MSITFSRENVRHGVVLVTLRRYLFYIKFWIYNELTQFIKYEIIEFS